MARQDEVEQPYIVWVDYGQEGWSPHGFPSEKAALEYVQYGALSATWVLTRRMEICAYEWRGLGDPPPARGPLT